MSEEIHADEPLRTAGVALEDAAAAVVCLHGRGARAESVLAFADEFDATDRAYLAPQASEWRWYPESFMAPMADNQPWLAAALDRVGSVLERIEDAGIPLGRTALLGFSQGACLASEYVARNATRYGGLIAFSGGLIGPDGTPREYDGSLDGTPAFVGCSDRDPHIPLDRVEETTAILSDLGASVDERIYEGMGHTVNRDELDAAAAIVRDLA